jgi:hypothetical protein
MHRVVLIGNLRRIVILNTNLGGRIVSQVEVFYQGSASFVLGEI